MPQTVEAMKEDAASAKKAISDAATDMKGKVDEKFVEIGKTSRDDVDAARKAMSDVAGDIKEKVQPDPEPTLFEKITDPVKETASNVVGYVKETFTSA